jgi:hypothetical protein
MAPKVPPSDATTHATPNRTKPALLVYRKCITSGLDDLALRSTEPADHIAIDSVSACRNYEPEIRKLLKSTGLVRLKETYTVEAMDRVVILRAGKVKHHPLTDVAH